jgi:threonine synthase
VSEREIEEAHRLVARVEGIWTAPESAALVAALRVLKDRGEVARDAETLLVFTGTGLKYAPPPLPAPTHLEGTEEEILARVRRAVGA